VAGAFGLGLSSLSAITTPRANWSSKYDHARVAPPTAHGRVTSSHGDTSDVPIHRITIRVAVPPNVSAVLPLRDLTRRLEEGGLVVVGVESTREGDEAPSDPSALL
jgi:hypothetical protein